MNAEDDLTSAAGSLWHPVPTFSRPARGAADRLGALWREIDNRLSLPDPQCRACGRCCDFREARHTLFAARAELDFCLDWARRHLPLRPAEAARRVAEGLCPFWEGGLCTVRSVRPVGCRVYFCSRERTTERDELAVWAHRRLRDISAELGQPWWYGPALTYLGTNIPLLKVPC